VVSHNGQIVQLPKPKKENSFWEDLFGGITKGIELGEKLLPFFGYHGQHSARTGLTTSVSTSKGGWVGMAKPSIVRGPGAPKIRQVGDRFVVTHQGELAELLKNDDDGIPYERGDVMYDIALNPEVEEWCGAIAKFEKFRFRNIAVTYVPAVPTTASGKLIGWFESDVDNAELGGNGEESIRRAMSTSTSAQVDIWTTHSWVKSFRTEDDQWWYCGSNFHEARLAYQGKFTVMAGSEMNEDELPDSLGDLIVTYEIEFTVANINNGIIPGTSASYVSSATASHDALFLGLVAQRQIDKGSTPDNIVPDGVEIRTNVAGSQLYLPPGYWHVDLLLQAGADLGTFEWAVGGGSRFLRPNDGYDDESHVVNSTGHDIAAMCTLAMVDGGYLTATTTNAVHNIGTVNLRVCSMGGALPYESDLITLRRLNATLDKLGIKAPQLPVTYGGRQLKSRWCPVVYRGKSSRRASSSSSTASTAALKDDPPPSTVPAASQQIIASQQPVVAPVVTTVVLPNACAPPRRTH